MGNINPKKNELSLSIDNRTATAARTLKYQSLAREMGMS